MDDDDFEGDAFAEAAEWRRLRRIMHEHERNQKVVRALATVIDAAIVMKNVAPWAIIAGGSLLLYLNRALLLGGGGG